MSAPLVPAEPNQSEATRSIQSRTTKGGRRLHYELTCLQQPERARACGSGQKSAADRRPVDPPPVVQLRVLEGPTPDDSKDITLGYNANFFVFVDLAHARPMANGRVQTPAATSPPVLTGAPVSGMAYLDRPAEAGYFLFPDLSVRHEGRYVLGFSLYEELKDDQDYDADPQDTDPTPGFYLRMRIQSNPFVVFSAKKFPGLTSSTSLSRTISEQGCRVRIRRDVRMRRRDGKPSTGDYDKEDDGARSGRGQTPDIRKDQYRGRSTSNSSEQRAPYPERRPSEVDAYPPPPPPPGPAPVNHARYGSDASNGGYSSHYAPAAPQLPPISPTSAHYPPQPSPYSAGPAQPPYNYQNRAPQPYGASATPTTPRDPYDRRPSNATVPPSPSHSHYGPKDDYRRESEYPKPESEYQRGPEPRRDSASYPHLAAVQSAPSTTGPVRLPPIDAVSRAPMLPGPSNLPSTIYPPPPARNDFIEPAPPGPPPVQEPVRAGIKRAFNDTFVDASRSLYDGQRPQDPHHQAATHGRTSHFDPEDPEKMVYSRADGREVYKTSNAFYTL